jgi:hypothetical protein
MLVVVGGLGLGVALWPVLFSEAQQEGAGAPGGKGGVPKAEPVQGTPPKSEKGEGSEYVIEPFDRLTIRVTGTLPNQPIAGEYLVQPEGRVRLGYSYGAVRVAGQTLDQAEKAIRKHLLQFLRDPQMYLEVAAYGSQILKAQEEVQRLREEVEKRRAQLQDAKKRLRLAESRLEGVRLRYGAPGERGAKGSAPSGSKCPPPYFGLDK